MADPINLTLSNPIKALGQDLSALTLRPMTAGDLRRRGFPFILRQSGDTISEVIDAGVVSGLIADLAGIPVSSVDMLTPSDWMDATNAVRRFLVDTTPAGSSPPPGV